MVTDYTTLPRMADGEASGYRLVNSKFPPIDLFEDVADADDFDALYQLQALTNPRLRAEVGDLNLLRLDEIPFGIDGCSYATAPFTHVNPDGGRFNDGQFGVLYIADAMETAIAEVAYHQQRYWQGVHNLAFDRLVFRGLVCIFQTTGICDATSLPPDDPIYDPDSYQVSQAAGRSLRQQSDVNGLRYHAVRRPGAHCWGLFTPRSVRRIHQSCHYEFIWMGEAIGSINRITLP
ncbi:RES family NAD+ phosphorylase [Marinobacter xestospongiae]|uniref:RES family NAD+ phosphorylase n=1 Tax=Marinobacter xestospongiae TaxID=994319 RepID=A0ABU3W049_9GAMM|nr:RES family NAD+ phosphorylase [Marinobacter xestospongiae]MDV2079371.1 RES family NAD+ phosphorylase [Marinobacter xestospongiae]